MTLPVAYNTIQMSQVNTELGFSSTRQTQLGESAVRTLAGVPSGQIAFSNLHGKSNFTRTWTGDTWSPVRLAAITAGYYFNSDGTVNRTRTGSANSDTMWANTTLAGGGNNWWIYFGQTSSNGQGTLSGSALDTWHQLSTARYLSLNKSTVGYATRTFNVYFSKDGGSSWEGASPYTLILEATYDV